MIYLLFRSENSVSGIAESRTDIGVFVQTSVQMSYIDLNIGMRFAQPLKTLGSSYDAHELDVLSAMLLNKVHCLCTGTAGSQHGIKNNDGTLVDGFRELSLIHI